MMSFEAPGPSTLSIGFSENAHVIQFWVAGKAAARAFQFLENLLEAHDGRGL